MWCVNECAEIWKDDALQLERNSHGVTREQLYASYLERDRPKLPIVLLLGECGEWRKVEGQKGTDRVRGSGLIDLTL